ncbi:MAG: hypothetical protein QOI24_916 [Acidobacteriota bacterium]|nr:hypothetical protein [Acidobacteriota bacterium]
MPNSTQLVPSPVEPFVIERRRFLVLGSAAAVAFAARGVSAAVAPTPASAELPASLAVAFVDRLESRAAAIGGAGVLAASGLTVGDPSFISRSAKVTVLGMWRAQNRQGSVSVALKAYYPTTLYSGGDVPCYVWSHLSRNATDAQRPASFRIPIDSAGLRLEVETTAPRSAIVEKVRGRVSSLAMSDDASRPRTREALADLKNVASLSLGIDRGASKLRAGKYVLAMLPAGAATPDWSAVRYTPANVSGPLSVRSLLGETAPAFDYVIVDVDFAG